MRLKILVLVALVIVTSAFAAGWKWKAGKATTPHTAVALAKHDQYTPSGWSWGEDAL